MNILEPGYKVPCDRTILKRLENLYAVVKSKVLGNLSEIQSVSISIDEWSSRATESYLSVEVHFINQDFSIHHITLSNEMMEDRPTAANIAKEVQDCIESWNLTGRVQ